MSVRSAFNAVLLIVGMALGLGCGGDSFDPAPMLSQENLYWRLDLNHKAVLLSMTAPYDTLQLVATPRNHLNAPISGAPAPQYISRDLTRVSVTSGGLLYAVAPTSPGTVVPVIAQLRVNGVTHVDTVFVSVANIDPIPFIDSISIQPVPPDSAKIALTPRGLAGTTSVALQDTIAVRAFSATGAPVLTIPGSPSGILPIRLSIADTSIAQFSSDPFTWADKLAVIWGFRASTTMIDARTTAFGVSLVDSLSYRVGWPLNVVVGVRYPGTTTQSASGGMASANFFATPVTRIGVGGVVSWLPGALFPPDPRVNTEILFDPGDLSNIRPVVPVPPYLRFQDIIACLLVIVGGDCTGSGNLTITETKATAARLFVAPGTYEYRSSQFPESVGKVIVIDER